MSKTSEEKRDADAGRRFNSMKNKDLADVLADFCNGKYEQTPANEAKFNALMRVIIGRLKTLDGAKVACAGAVKQDKVAKRSIIRKAMHESEPRY